VISGEIRNLAENAAHNVQDITTTITGVMERINETTRISLETGSKITNMTNSFHEVGNSYNDILVGMQDIAASSSQITSGIKTVQENSTMVADFSSDVHSVMDELQQLITNINEMSREYMQEMERSV
jgi:methyl-accepting chemotaxis protein